MARTALRLASHSTDSSSYVLVGRDQHSRTTLREIPPLSCSFLKVLPYGAIFLLQLLSQRPFTQEPDVLQNSKKDLFRKSIESPVDFFSNSHFFSFRDKIPFIRAAQPVLGVFSILPPKFMLTVAEFRFPRSSESQRMSFPSYWTSHHLFLLI